MYQYEDDAPSTNSTIVFGLNQGAAKVTKFEWINNAGAGGAEGEALDIQITIEGQERPVSKRMFPIKKAFLPDNGGEIIDPAHPAFKKAVAEFNAIIIHIMHCFVPEDVLRTALGTPIANFKEFCKVLVSLLPAKFEEIPLDVFAQYQWGIKTDNKMTYLEFPKKMSYGRWICKEVKPVGSWKTVKINDPETSTPNALKYVDDQGNIHPFVRNGWYMNSNFANQQKDEASASTGIPTGEVDPNAQAGTQTAGSGNW
jgi:hypothetical protein